MPFDFLRRKNAAQSPAKPAARSKSPAAKAKVADAPSRVERTPKGTPVPFDGLTEEWRLVGHMYLETRLSDALNKRQAMAISEVSWAPMDGTGSFSPVPGLKSVDPYDLIVVLASESSKPALSDDEKATKVVQKIPFGVSLEAPPLRIVGTVFLNPGSTPQQLLDRSAEMFVPVVGGVAYLGDRAVSDPSVDAILVNRFYLRGVKVTSGPSGDPAPEAPAAESKEARAAQDALEAKRTAVRPSSRPKRGGLGPRI